MVIGIMRIALLIFLYIPAQWYKIRKKGEFREAAALFFSNSKAKNETALNELAE